MEPRHDTLSEIDRRLDAEGVARLTLDPARTRATPLALIYDGLAGPLDAPRRAALADGLARTAAAIRDYFPCNLFWDLEGLAAHLTADARDAREITLAFDDLVALHALFGAGTAIRFRYVHDFVYGFDWARWVRREPLARRAIHPYSRAFMRVMLARGAELLAQIAAHDPTYPPIADTAHRNPFGFSRAPEDERRLHRELAALDLVPIRAWSFDAAATWDRPFASERAARAEALGISAPAR